MTNLIDITGSKRGVLLSFFLDNPTSKIHLRALSRKVGISPTWISRVAPALKKVGLVDIESAPYSREVVISAKRGDSRFVSLKRAYNLSKLHELGEFLDESYGRPQCIVLFGSYAKGVDTESSDIDIAVITTRKVHVDLKEFNENTNRKIVIKELNPKGIPKEFKESLANGIVLKGYLRIT